MSSVDVKPTSNRKPAGKADAPNEPFKRALASCTRALARQPELEIAFSADKPSLLASPEGAKARLPEPPRKPNPREAAIVRGLADSFALRLACHNDALHRRLAPPSPPARALFDAVEQARVEAIGSRRMQGVASNITAMLDDRYHRSPFAEARTREEAPLEDAVAMLARERMTGLEPPRGAARLVELWRPFIEEKAGADLDRLSDALLDQRAYARLVRKLLSSLGLASDSDPDAEESDEETEDKTPPEDADEAEGEGEDQQSQDSMQREAADDTADDAEEGAIETVEAPSSELEDEGDTGEAEEATESRPPQPQAAEKRGPDYKAYTTRFDEIIDADELCDSDELQRLRDYLDKQLQSLAFGRRPPRQSAAAAADGAAEPLMGVRSRRGRARHRPAAARDHRFAAAFVFQAGEGHGVPRYGGDAADRQFRLDARSPDHGRGDLRRHSRAHTRAMRRQGGDSRLHDPRLERRAVARVPGFRPASPPIRDASTICAISSTRPRTRRGGARAKISA